MSDNSTTPPSYPWNETIRTVLFALVIAMTFRSLAFEPFHIPSGSMKSNLLVGDYLFVSKYAYGYSRYSFPFGIDFYDGRIAKFSTPKRGDVVVFRPPSNTHVDFIKRVIGLPGDSIQLRNGVVYLNGSALPREPIDVWDDVNEQTGDIDPVPRLREQLPEGKEITILKHTFGNADNTKIFIVPEGKYFMMGDNRDNSHDSRFEDVGFVSEENLVGRAEIIFFSADETFNIFNPLSWFGSMRFSRFFKLIH